MRRVPQRLIVCALGVGLLVLVLVGLTGGPGETRSTGTATGHPHVIGTTSPSRRANARRSPPATRTMRTPQRVARAFLSAFVDREAGRPAAAWRAAISRTSSAAVTRLLTTARVRHRRMVRLNGLQVEAAEPGIVKASAVLDYGHQLGRGVFEFRLIRAGGAWRVADFYP